MILRTFLPLAALAFCLEATAQRSETLLERDWRLIRQDNSAYSDPDYDDSSWQSVTIPHDWSISGSFSESSDEPSGGTTGGLIYAGTGWYRLHFDVPDYRPGCRVELLFDGAMSHPSVYVNGQYAGGWEYGYNAFSVDISSYVEAEDNVLAVRLYNEKEQSRWYPGAGLYRNVHLIVSDAAHIPTWGVQVLTPNVTDSQADVEIYTTVDLPDDRTGYTLSTEILNPQGDVVATSQTDLSGTTDSIVHESMQVDSPQRWDIYTPNLYQVVSKIYEDDTLCDSVATTFGIRTIEVVADQGFLLNGRVVKFKGVCNHHDLGPLGAAVNESALRRRLLQLVDMGANAIRTAHNMPSPELIRLCDEMGIMVMAESFDEWSTGKVTNGYNKYFDEWAERDLVNLIRHFRNSPSVVMWSIGNEVSEQYNATTGLQLTEWLQDICHREDPTRPVTMGMDAADAVVSNGIAAALDVPGFNYRSYKYQNNYDNLPQKVVLGTESASTVSSRGVYKFPVTRGSMLTYTDNQSSSYDVEHCTWSNLPEDDWIWHDEKDWTMGEFVWTGYDYLGEPTPYSEDWPSHSSYFGIIDLANIPKDRYYLYRSHWAPEKETLHIVPHWTWSGREGKVTPVFVYTNYPSAELFVNGVSQGVMTKDTTITVENSDTEDDEAALTRQKRYRLMWPDVVYEPGTLRVVAYDEEGNAVAEKEVHTAGDAYSLEVEADTLPLRAGGRDLCYIRVRMVDEDGNLVPDATNRIRFSVSGAGTYKAAANGDPTCTTRFSLTYMPLFGGQLTAIVATTDEPGTFTFTATATTTGILPASVTCTVQGDESIETAIRDIVTTGQKPELNFSKGIVTVKSEQPCHVAVYSLDGRRVAYANGNSLDIRRLSSGVYLIKADNSQGSAHMKIALQR